MKAYVLGYRANKPQAERTEFQYGARPLPDSRYTTRTSAEVDCRTLNQSAFRTGSHQCSFSVDKLPEGDFGIICVCHPF
jgi:hypothetical protein